MSGVFQSQSAKLQYINNVTTGEKSLQCFTLFCFLMQCQFSGNVTNIPAVLQPSSTCQWFGLLTVCCQHFTHQPIVFLRCEANAYFIGSGYAGSLFSCLSCLAPSVTRVCILARFVRRTKKKERLLVVYRKPHRKVTKLKSKFNLILG